MWKAFKFFRSWLRVFSEKTMAGRFYQRSFSENVLQVGDVFVLFVFNWFRSKESLVLSCGISLQEYQFKASVNQQTYPMIYETVAKEEILIKRKESEWNKTISFFLFNRQRHIGFQFVFFLSKKSPLIPVKNRLRVIRLAEFNFNSFKIFLRKKHL